MKLLIRRSTKKHRKKTGFLTRKKTRGGRKILKNQRDRMMGKPKPKPKPRSKRRK